METVKAVLDLANGLMAGGAHGVTIVAGLFVIRECAVRQVEREQQRRYLNQAVAARQMPPPPATR